MNITDIDQKHLFDPVPVGKDATWAYYSPLTLTTKTFQIGSLRFAMTAHTKAIGNFALFLYLVEQAGLAKEITEYNGAYVDRNKRLGGGPSMHSVGAAFDIDDHLNPQGSKPKMATTLVNIGMVCGLFWGGWFNGKYVDGMHYQKGVEFASLVGLKASGRYVPVVTWRPGMKWEPGSGLVKSSVTGVGLGADKPAPGPSGLSSVGPEIGGRTVDGTGKAYMSRPGVGRLMSDGHFYLRAAELPLLLPVTINDPVKEHGLVISMNPPKAQAVP